MKAESNACYKFHGTLHRNCSASTVDIADGTALSLVVGDTYKTVTVDPPLIDGILKLLFKEFINQNATGKANK